jgi:hypothetical protein
VICVSSADRIVLPVIATLQVIAYEVDMAVHLPKTDSDGLALAFHLGPVPVQRA